MDNCPYTIPVSDLQGIVALISKDRTVSGHVFVARSDITMLCCDAWLLPTDSGLSITKSWRDAAAVCGVHELTSSDARSFWRSRTSRALATKPWRSGQGVAPAPIPILTDVGAYEGEDPDWYLAAVSDFVAEAKRSTLHSQWRTKSLLALPLIGTGDGGQASHKGAMANNLLKRLNIEAEKNDLDFALILADDTAYAATQWVRRKNEAVFAGLSAQDIIVLDQLAEYARSGHLVLFAGAGLSRSAGLPLWKDLLGLLASKVELTVEELKALDTLPLIDAASILEKRLVAKDRDLRKMAINETNASCFGIAHALVAGMPITERVTTNYDELIERSLSAIGRPTAVLPYDPSSIGNGWLLKLHGSVSHESESDDIVLTRQDYLRYDSRRGALYGIVQALLLTRHMLFLGFSLEDDNFFGLVDEVRQAVEGPRRNQTSSAPFGTAFLPSGSVFKRELWGDEVRIVELGQLGEYPRKLEIALDYLACMASANVTHLLNDSFNDILNHDEKLLKRAVLALKANLGDRNSATFETTRRYLRELGDLDTY